MRVLHITGDAGVGGVESHLVTLARNRGVDPSSIHDFAFTTEGPAIELIHGAGAQACYVGRVSYRSPRELFAARKRLSGLCSQHRYDVAVLHQYTYLLAAFGDMLLRRNIKMVRYFHNEIDHDYWLERLVRVTYTPRLNLSVFDSRFLLESIPAENGAVVYYPVDRRLVLDGENRNRIRSEFDTSAGEPVVVQLCRMAERKGHLRLLRALGALRALKWTCWIVGGPQTDEQAVYYKKVTSLADELGIADRVRFLGIRTDVAELLAASDIFCHPNTLPPEPFGIVFVEALQAGLPVVTSAMGGALEIVSEQCGVLVPPDDDQALLDALKRLLTDESLRREMSVAARARGEAFTPRVQIPLLNEALKATLAKN